MVGPRYFSLSVSLLAFIASGCAGVPRAVEGGVLKELWPKISTKELIRVRGVGVAPTTPMTKTAGRGRSRIAALAAARYELLSVVKGVKLSGGVTVSQLMEKEMLVRELVDDVVMGGEEVLTEWTADSGCVATLELRRSTVERLIHEKSEREKGLERRIAKDIEEIKKLNEAIAALGAGRYKTEDVEKIKWTALEMAGTLRKMDALTKRSEASRNRSGFGSDDQQLFQDLGNFISRLCTDDNGNPTGDCE